MDFEARCLDRQDKVKPVMEEMKEWLETEGLRYSRSPLTGKAVTYAYTRRDAMMRVLEDGRLLPDNNLAGNGIRPITLGHKHYLFCGNHESAENMCVIQSLLATCRNHDINPRPYLDSAIASMPYFEKATEDDIRVLLPHKWKLFHPEAIMTTPVRQLAKWDIQQIHISATTSKSCSRCCNMLDVQGVLQLMLKYQPWLIFD